MYKNNNNWNIYARIFARNKFLRKLDQLCFEDDKLEFY